jgi:hypothetical protein
MTTAPGQPRVLIVEDDESVRMLLRDICEEYAWNVVTAADRADANLGAGLHSELAALLAMIVIPNYRAFRIEITAHAVGDAWDAGIRIRCPHTNEVRRSKYLPCHKPSATEAEHSAEVWARQWMDFAARLSAVVKCVQARTTGRQRAATTSAIAADTARRGGF